MFTKSNEPKLCKILPVGCVARRCMRASRARSRATGGRGWRVAALARWREYSARARSHTCRKHIIYINTAKA